VTTSGYHTYADQRLSFFPREPAIPFRACICHGPPVVINCYVRGSSAVNPDRAVQTSRVGTPGNLRALQCICTPVCPSGWRLLSTRFFYLLPAIFRALCQQHSAGDEVAARCGFPTQPRRLSPRMRSSTGKDTVERILSCRTPITTVLTISLVEQR
jgi:hypothetical protein